MDKIKIFFADDTEYSDATSIDKGCRHDIIVQIGAFLFHPALYHVATLAQEFNESLAQNQVYEIDNTLILVKQVSKDEIIKTILSLYESKYFDRAKSIDLKEEYKGSFDLFPHLQTLAGWIQVY